MPSKEVALDLAAFVDSDEARALDVPRGLVRRIAGALLESAYDGLGKKPRLFDGEDVNAILARVLPGHFARADPAALHVPAVTEAFFAHVEASEVVTQAFEIHSALPGALEAFAAAVKGGEQAHTRTRAPETVQHKADKLGRNDPCFCGSGKKFKKCHGRGS